VLVLTVAVPKLRVKKDKPCFPALAGAVVFFCSIMVNVITNMLLIMVPLLIIIGQENRGRAPICLGDYPEFDAAPVVIDGKQAASLGKCPLVRCAVFGANVAPVAVRVMGKRRADFIRAKLLHSGRGHYYCSQRKLAGGCRSEYVAIHIFAL
jgi:hypothetical protein